MIPRISSRWILGWFVVLSVSAAAQSNSAGIPVTDDLVVAKCGSCHKRDSTGIMDRISWERTTPEGWQDVLKRMIVVNGISISPVEARSIVRYLSTNHGLAPQEARSVLYDVERRVHEETAVADRNVRNTCSRCHNLEKALSWHRSAEDWKQFGEDHMKRFQLKPSEAVAYFTKAAPLNTPEWTEWSSQPRNPNVAGRWLLTASLPGHGRYIGEMQVEPTGGDEFNTTIRMTSVEDGSVLLRAGRSAVYGGYAWRGRSKGNQPGGPPAGDPQNEAREVMWFAPDQTTAEGRWFWGQYQEFGFDVQFRRPAATPMLLSAAPTSLKAGSEGNRIRLLGDNFPAKVTPADVDLGIGVTIRRVVSSTSTEVIVEADAAPDARAGRRDARLGQTVLSGALAVYDRVDYLAVSPASALAAFADRTHPLGYQQFTATAYQRGPDEKLHTADDLDLGPISANWSIEVFYAAEEASSGVVGEISPAGLFTPAAKNPEQNFDVWAVATATDVASPDGKPLIGKSYLVVTVPTYTFNGRRYVRDLGRWVDDGPAAQ